MGMEQRVCSIDGCGGKHASLDLCAKHYKAHQRRRGMIRVSERLCTANDCGRDHYAKGLCKKHYKESQPDRECSVDDCDRRAVGGDRYCCSHRRRASAGRLDTPIRLRGRVGCTADGCAGEHYGMGLCRRHYGRRRTAENPGHAALLGKYRITATERDALFSAQDGLCAICRNADATDIDHDHSHGCSDNPKRGCRECVRGGLCQRCNITLAFLEGYRQPSRSKYRYIQRLIDDPWWRARAKFYLKARPFAGTPDPVTGLSWAVEEEEIA